MPLYRRGILWQDGEDRSQKFFGKCYLLSMSHICEAYQMVNQAHRKNPTDKDNIGKLNVEMI